MAGFSAFVARHLWLRIAAVVCIIAGAVIAVVMGAMLVVRMNPLDRYPFSTSRVEPTRAASAAPATGRFNTQRIHDRMGNAGMVTIYTTPGEEPIYIIVGADEITLRIGRPQDIDAALALVPMLFADQAQGEAARRVAGEVIRAGCNDARPAGDVMVTAQLAPSAGAGMCVVVFA